MSSRRRRAPSRRGLERFVEMLTSETAQKAVVAIMVFVILLFLSGTVYSLTTSNPISLAFLPGGSIRVFFWSMSAQTHAETMVVFLYYLLGAGGLWLYLSAVTRPFNPRSTRYMLFFSFLLLLLAGIGLYSAYVAKYIRP